jgi:hypothetical protein
MQPHAASRWLNRVALRVPAARLLEVAGGSFVSRVVPVDRARRSVELPTEVLPAVREVPVLRSTQATSIDYGQTLATVTQLDVPAVHDSGYVGTGVLVCIVDEGFNYYWKQEALRVIPFAPGFTRDFVDGDTTVFDTSACCSGSYTHGTEVMGCLAGNLPGKYVGTGFGAQYALARTEVAVSETPIEMVYWGQGAEWADSLGGDVISYAHGYSTVDQPAARYTTHQRDGHRPP